jgi:hypothetical protein
MCCAHEAKTITSPAFISNDAALVSRQGDAGSAMYDFGHLTGSLWGLTRCPDGSSDSWRVNGQVWHIPQSTVFVWNEFGSVQELAPSNTEIHLSARETGCEIQAVFLGTDGQTMLVQGMGELKDCEGAWERGYVCPTQTSVNAPVYYDSATSTINSDWGSPLAAGGSATFEFAWNHGAANLWFLTQCPDGTHDSWFVDGNVWHVPISSEYRWSLYGSVSGNTPVLTPREPGCRIAGAYLGNDEPSMDFMNSCPAANMWKCPIRGTATGNIQGLLDNVIHGECTATLGQSTSCSGSITFPFDNRGDVWALTMCDDNTEDSWYVNGAVWHVPQSSTLQWHKYGPIQGDSLTLDVREKNCRISGLFRGYGHPSAQHLQCYPSIKSATECQVYRPENKAFDNTSVTLFYSQHRSVHKVMVNAVSGQTISRESCATGFVSATGIAATEDAGLFVVDYGAATLEYVAAGCGARHTVIPQGHGMGIPYDVEILHIYGKLLVATISQPAIYYVEVDCDKKLSTWVNSGATNQLASGLTQCSDMYGNDGFLFVEQGNSLQFFNAITQDKFELLPSNSGVVDISDVDYSCRGIYFTANDNNQLWVCNHDEQGTNVASCTEPMANCRRACGPLVDGSTCMDLKNPNGLAVDCNCNVYVGNKGNGNLVSYVNQLDLGLVLNNDAYLNDVEVCGPATCSDPAPVGQSCGAVNGGGQSATTGDVVTWVVSASEPVARPSFITCAVGSTALNFQWSSADTFAETHVASYQVQASDPSGEILCTFGPLVDALGQTSEITASPNNDCRVVIGASPSNTPSRSPSPSPSVSPPPEYSLQVEMHFESGECATEGCVNDDALDNVTIRMSSSVAKVKAVETSELGQCASDGGTPTPSGQSFFCFFFLAFTDLHRWDISDFTIFRLTANGPPPGFHVSPDIFPANTYPNTVATTQSRASVAAAVNCEGLPSAAPLRWTWLRKADQGPCYFDPELNNFELCSPAGKDLNNEDYSDISGAVLPTDAIFKDVFCPT